MVVLLVTLGAASPGGEGSFETRSASRLDLLRSCATRLEREEAVSGLLVTFPEVGAASSSRLEAVLQIPKCGSSTIKGYASRRFGKNASLNVWAQT